MSAEEQVWTLKYWPPSPLDPGGIFVSGVLGRGESVVVVPKARAEAAEARVAEMEQQFAASRSPEAVERAEAAAVEAYQEYAAAHTTEHTSAGHGDALCFAVRAALDATSEKEKADG